MTTTSCFYYRQPPAVPTISDYSTSCLYYFHCQYNYKPVPFDKINCHLLLLFTRTSNKNNWRGRCSYWSRNNLKSSKNIQVIFYDSFSFMSASFLYPWLNWSLLHNSQFITAPTLSCLLFLLNYVFCLFFNWHNCFWCIVLYRTNQQTLPNNRYRYDSYFNMT